MGGGGFAAYFRGFAFGVAALLLEGFEFGFVGGEFVIDAFDIEGEEGEFLTFFTPGLGGAAGKIEVGGVCLGTEGEGEDAMFDGGSAVLAPHAVGDQADEGFFDGSGGEVMFVDASAVCGVYLGLFLGKDYVLAG